MEKNASSDIIFVTLLNFLNDFWCYDIQHNDTQHNDIQHIDIQHNDTQHKGFICDT